MGSWGLLSSFAPWLCLSVNARYEFSSEEAMKKRQPMTSNCVCPSEGSLEWTNLNSLTILPWGRCFSVTFSACA